MDETAEECARRELKEETGLELGKVRELGTFSDITRDPRERVISIAFYSLARHSAVKGGDDAAKAKWWAIDDIPHLAFDHDYILRKAMKRIRQDIHFEPVGFDLLDEQFTIAELQRLYESILGVNFDRRNFYRKMLQTGVLEEVEEDEMPRRAYFGKRKEMKRMDIDALFGSPVAKNAEPCMPTCEAAPSSAPDCIEEEEGERSAGRKKKKLFRFNKEQYSRMKENDNFRLEF
jgi:ADP-ribose pyrophosphatase YjhB (NUDIX family)